MLIGACGIACTACRYYLRGLCLGCTRGDRCPTEKTVCSPCPILRCAAARNIAYCIRDCEEFPCVLYEDQWPRCWPQTGVPGAKVVLFDEGESASPIISAADSGAEPLNSTELRILCLGAFRVYQGSEEIQPDAWGQDKGPTQKIKALLAYLLSRKERGARKETIIDLLWPEKVELARSNSVFHLTLHCLRRALEPEIESGSASSYIRYREGRYYFDPLKPCWIDMEAFVAYCQQAQMKRQTSDVEAAMAKWTLAFELYGGDYMAGISNKYTENELHDWCMPTRIYLRELYVTGLLETARYYYQLNRYDLGIKYAQKALKIEPTIEAAHQIAMQCLIKSERLNEATHQYRLCKAQLAWYADRPPSEQTNFLYQQIYEETKHV